MPKALLGRAQSILTGESGSVAKFTDVVTAQKAVYQDKTCLLFSARPAASCVLQAGWSVCTCWSGVFADAGVECLHMQANASS